MLDDAEPDACRGGERFAHDAVFEDRMAVVGDGHGACGLERGEVVQRFTFGSARGSADGKDANARATFGCEHPAGRFQASR